MSDCLNCHRPIPDGATTCSACGADQERLREMLGRDRAARPQVQPAPGRRRSFPVVPVALGIVAVGLVAYLMWPKHFPQVVLTPSKANTKGLDGCLAKEKCILVYLAPWCHYCKQTIPVVRQMTERFNESTEIGIKAIIGSDSAEKLEAMAAEIGANTYVDPDRRFWKAAGIEGVPHWYVVDSRGYLRGDVSGFGPMEAVLSELGL